MVPLTKYNPLASSKVLFGWIDDADVDNNIGFKASGFIVKYINRFHYLTAGHCFGLEKHVTIDELKHFLLMQPHNDGKCDYIQLDAFAHPFTTNGQIEADDIVGMTVKQSDETKIWGFIDHSNEYLTTITECLNKSDQLIVSGWYQHSQTDLIDYEKKVVRHWPESISFIYKENNGNYMHSAELDLGLASHFGYAGSNFSGLSGSPVWIIEMNKTLTWAGMVLQSSGNILRFVDSGFIDKRWKTVDSQFAQNSA